MDKIKKLFGLSPEDSKLLDDVRLNYKAIFDTVNQFQNVKGIKPPFDADTWEQTLIDYQLAIGELTNDPSLIADPITKQLRRRSDEELAEAKSTAQARYKLLEESFIKSFVQLKTQEAKVRGEFKQANSEDVKNFQNAAAEAGKIAFDNLQKSGVAVLTFEENLFKSTKRVEELNKKLLELAPAARRGFLIENIDQFVEEYDLAIDKIITNQTELEALQEKLRKKNYTEEEKYKTSIEELNKIFSKKEFEGLNLTYEEKLILLEKYLAKEVESTEKAEDDIAKKRKEQLDTLQKAFDMFNDLVGETSSLIQQKISMDLKMLEKSFNESLNSVVGDTEEANQKRLELTKQYETQKAEIEKQATIKSLQAQKLQAIASAASAIIAAQELTPPFNVIQSIIVAGVTAAQVSLIQQQIDQARSMAGGGMIFGASHENGGVMVGGGYNLEGGESVINKVSTVQYGNLLSSINQMGGGRAITNSAQNGLMEERLMQAIAKTKNEPIRAYVLNSEITSGQAINRRLSELASL